MNAFPRLGLIFMASCLLFQSCQAPPPAPSASGSVGVVSSSSSPETSPWTAQRVLELLPEAFFAPLKSAHPKLYAGIAPLPARQALLADAPVVHHNCLTYTLEPAEIKKSHRQEYQEFERFNEVNLCVYPIKGGEGDFVVYLQIIKNCKGLCEEYPAELHLRLCKRYQAQSQTWQDYEADFDAAAAEALSPVPVAGTAFSLMPKGLCQRKAVADFERGRNRRVSGDTDMARLAWEQAGACLVWTGKKFE